MCKRRIQNFKGKVVALRHNCSTELIHYFLVSAETDESVIKEAESRIDKIIEEYGEKHHDDFADFDYYEAATEAFDSLNIEYDTFREDITIYV